MKPHRSVLLILCATLFVAVAGRSAQAQVLVLDGPDKKAQSTVLVHADLTNGAENAYSIPDNQDLVITDVIATCRTINSCVLNLLGPSHNASDEMLMFVVAPESTVSHAFTTGIRVLGGNSAQLFIQNYVQPGPNSLLTVTITGYLVKK
jgi:hypothetical protein